MSVAISSLRSRGSVARTAPAGRRFVLRVSHRGAGPGVGRIERFDSGPPTSGAGALPSRSRIVFRRGAGSLGDA